MMANSVCIVSGCKEPRHTYPSQKCARCHKHHLEYAKGPRTKYNKGGKAALASRNRYIKAKKDGRPTETQLWRQRHPDKWRAQKEKERRKLGMLPRPTRIINKCGCGCEGFTSKRAKYLPGHIETVRERAHLERTREIFNRMGVPMPDFDSDTTTAVGYTRTRARHGLNPRQIDALLAYQGGRCRVCGTSDPGAPQWSIDHDHKHCPGQYSCGRCVRGIICRPCNTALGGARDNPGILRALAAYLDDYEQRRTV